jgi:hypothetical protein
VPEEVTGRWRRQRKTRTSARASEGMADDSAMRSHQVLTSNCSWQVPQDAWQPGTQTGAGGEDTTLLKRDPRRYDDHDPT